VQEDPGPHEREAGPAEALNGRAVLGVYQAWTVRERIHHLGEATQLALRAVVRQLGGVEVGEHTLRRICPEKVVQVTDAVPWYSRTVHPRVHRQVPGTPGGSPVRDAGGVVKRGSELSIRRLSQFLREERRADQHRTDNAGATRSEE